jgi:hypothetical protein
VEQVRGNDARRFAVALDEFGEAGAPRQRFDAQGARACKKVHYPRPGERRREVAVLIGLETALVGQRLEHREDRALDEVGSRAGFGRRAQRPPTRATRDNAHRIQLGSPACTMKSVK